MNPLQIITNHLENNPGLNVYYLDDPAKTVIFNDTRWLATIFQQNNNIEIMVYKGDDITLPLSDPQLYHKITQILAEQQQYQEQ